MKEAKTGPHENLGQLPDSLKELWLEIGGSCHLRCDYCFANSGGVDQCTDNLSVDQIRGYLADFASMGGTSIGIVGAGEPFHARNIDDCFSVMDTARTYGLHTTIFTTADIIDEKLAERLDAYLNVRLLVKYNSSDPTIQDTHVGVAGYTQRRDLALAMLMQRGYNDGRRLGLVTSILEDNAQEMEQMFRYARENHLIFDADTPIPRGRGSSCNREQIAKLAKDVIPRLQRIDREEFGNDWDVHATYIASPPCTRFNQHLYVKKDGTVIPCVGSPNVILGNIKTETLADIWEKPLTRIIRGHEYSGKCTSCANYQAQRCYSCLGRATDDLTGESILQKGSVPTCGCFNYRQGKAEGG